MALERVWKMLSAKWGVQIAEMIFQTRSKDFKISKQAAGVFSISTADQKSCSKDQPAAAFSWGI